MIALRVTAAERRIARLAMDVVLVQKHGPGAWRRNNDESTWLSEYEKGVYGMLAEIGLSHHLGVAYRTPPLDAAVPRADLVSPSGRFRYEVRSTPWLSRRAFESGRWRTFVYPREVADAGLIIARVDTFVAGGRMQLTGWIWASEAASWPLDRGRHLTRHAVPGPDPLRPAETLPREAGLPESVSVR